MKKFSFTFCQIFFNFPNFPMPSCCAVSFSKATLELQTA